jgi:HK97 family phage major capsid protein
MGVQELETRRMELVHGALAVVEKAKESGRMLTEDERKEADGRMAEIKAVDDQIAKAKSDAEFVAQILALGEGLEQTHPQSDAPGNVLRSNGKGTIGERFVNAPEYKAWLKSVAPSGMIPDGTRGLHSPAVMLGAIPLGRKDLITGASDVSAGAFVQTDYTGIYEPLGRYALALRDLISIRQTTSDIVEFVRQTQQVTEAAPTPEANVKDYTGATGEIEGRKPQGAIYWEKVTATVKTIAVWVAATRRALADASQLRGIIDQELRDDIAEELEDQLLNGDGIGENFVGIVNSPGILLQAFNTDVLTTTRRAITSLLVTGRSRPTAFVFNPTDWENADLMQDLAGQFYWGGPLQQGPPRLWGVPVAQSFAHTAGTTNLADWRKAVLWDRQATQIFVTDSHSDYFIRNIIAILAEMRAAFGLIRPSAFCDVSLA